MFLTSFEFNNVSSICYMCYRVHTIFFTKILSEGNFNNFILKHAVFRDYIVWLPTPNVKHKDELLPTPTG